jgi:hypothetical protein
MLLFLEFPSFVRKNCWEKVGGDTGSFIHSWYVVTWWASYGTSRIEEVEIARILSEYCRNT